MFKYYMFAVLVVFFAVVSSPAYADDCGPCETYTLPSFAAIPVSGGGCPCPENPGWDCAYSGLKLTRAPESVCLEGEENIYVGGELYGTWQDMVVFTYYCTCVEGNMSCEVVQEQVFVPACMECRGLNEE